MSLRRRRRAARQHYRSCAGKRRYATRQRARLAISTVKAVSPQPHDDRLQAYWCGVCLAWHIGHGKG